MKQTYFDRIPTNLPGGFFVYRADGGEELCFADKNVLELYCCGTMDEFRKYTGNSFRGMVHPDDIDRVEREIKAQTFVRGGRHDYVRYRIVTRKGNIVFVEDFGHLVYDDDGDSFFYVFIINVEEPDYLALEKENWTERIRLQKSGKKNPLTGLIYENTFYAICEKNLADVRVNWLMFAIDLQNFKLFNDLYGRESGDNVLSTIGHELGRIARENDGVAGYFGGDDFALLVPSEHFDADELYGCIREIVISRGASVGFLPAIGASYSQGNLSAYTLYDQASLASHEAKGDLKVRVKYFSQAMVSKVEEDYRILSEFQNALAKDEITFYLQPQCRSSSAQVVGAEALARWIKPDGQMVPPVSFIPTLERYGFVTDLDIRIWEKVCQWSRKILDEGKPLVPVSVNISPVDIFTMDVPSFLEQLVDKYQLPKEAIKLEITESAYSEDSEKVRSTVQIFRDMGFVVLMDDFGSGFSSLNMLRELNVDIIKLDAYFLRVSKTNERKGMHIIESVINMAKTMAIPVIVEGVETKEQCDYLMGLGVQYIQGYYFYKPMNAYDFEKIISVEGKVDPNGFVYKANDEFRIREFLNDTVYTDSMLNHIIGPAAIYSLHGEDVDIVRFNQMFYQAVDVPDFAEKLLSIQRVMPEEEVPEMFRTLKKAYEDRLNGANGVFTFKKIDGSAARFLLHFYYLNEDEGAIRFYGSARDVTDITNLKRHLELLSRFTSRTVLFLLYNHDKYSFEIAAHGLEKVIGLSADEMEQELNENDFCNRLVPKNDCFFWNIAQKCAENRESTSSELTIRCTSGKLVDLIVDADYVDDEYGDVRCILSMRRK
jgi:EAL domain-containing protein (putative c-di-GMP-specific phosphodiesterase class I)/GGDEF domain-containing protein